MQHGIADVFVNGFVKIVFQLFLFPMEVALVEGDDDRNVVRLCHHEKTIDKAWLEVGLDHGDDEQCLVYIGSQQVDVVFFAGRLAQDIVGARYHGLD